MVPSLVQRARNLLLNTTTTKAPREHHSMMDSTPDDSHLTTGLASFSHLSQTIYSSNPVAIPPSFLQTVPSDGTHAITSHKIDWTRTDLPEYKGSYAIVLDNVLSHSECAELVDFAEESAGAGDEGVENRGWRPAMVNAGAGWEVFDAGYRKSDRIIWDQEHVVGRIWDRCLAAPGLWEELGILEGKKSILGWRACERGDRWRVTRLNERMRFLRYGKGEFFREHCDGSYHNEKTGERSFYTLHLYLNDSIQACPHLLNTGTPTPEGLTLGKLDQGEPLMGGATTFHSDDANNRQTVDVYPKAGRVLIFQHNGLVHSGNNVLAGVKYTMRTDLMFELLQE